MAKVTFEERAWSDPRLMKLSALLNVPEEVCVGVLLRLWHYTQEQLIVQATRSDIEIGLRKVSSWLNDTVQLDRNRLIECLIETQYLDPIGGDWLAIRGNRTRVEKVKNLRKTACEAAKTRWSKKTENVDKKVVNVEKITANALVPTVVDDAKIEKNVMRLGMRSAFGDNANLQMAKSKARKKVAKVADDDNGAGTREIIGSYCHAYKTRYGSNPVITGKSSGIIKRIVKDVGIDKTKRLIESYLRMDDEWFGTRNHDLPTLEANLSKIANFSETGKIISRSSVRSQERRSANKAAVETFLALDNDDAAPWEVR
jgi:hypothetical protein